MKQLAMMAAALFVLGACAPDADDDAAVDTAGPVIAPAPADTGMLDTTQMDTTRRDTVRP